VRPWSRHARLGLTREVTSAGANCYERTPNGLLIDIRTPTGNYNPLYDAQGDIIALVNTSGKVERNFRYGPYGENTKSEGTQTIPFPFGFKGGYRTLGGNTGKGNVASGLDHYGQRYYDPTTGRWTQQDPLEHLGSTTQGNQFLFTGSDPVNLTDPSGLEFFGEAGSYVGGFFGAVAGTVVGTVACGPVCGFAGGLAGGCRRIISGS
jgi:RHS repeat-associated protein